MAKLSKADLTSQDHLISFYSEDELKIKVDTLFLKLKELVTAENLTEARKAKKWLHITEEALYIKRQFR